MRQGRPRGLRAGHPNIGADEDWLSTGQAAQYCSVKPDTILKWIKRGKVRAERTAGGHYRIQRGELEPLILTPRRPAPEDAARRRSGQPLRCWEYLGRDEIPAECRECIVYRSRSAWCFELLERARDRGHAQRFCSDSCVDCSYYQRVRGHATRVLVITQDEEQERRLWERHRPDLHLCFARSGYEASAVIGQFRPTFAVIDHDLLAGAGRGLLVALRDDTRVPGIRVAIAAERGRAARIKARNRWEFVVGVLEKPVGMDAIASLVDAFPVEIGGPGER